MITPNENVREFEGLGLITPEDVQWLIAGSEAKGYRVSNARSIYYTTKRGISKGVTCFVMGDGSKSWRTWSARNTYDHLSDEEAAIFDHAIYEKRAARKAERKAARKSISCPVHVGDIFAGSYGYDATLWEFYEVTKVSASGKTVWVRELAHETTSGYGYNDWKCRPIPGEYVGKEERHTLQFDQYGSEITANFKVYSFMWAWLETNPTKWHDADNYH